MQHAIVSTIDESDYLSDEALSPVRHEYVDGHVYAMAGASKAHNTITLNIASRLRQHLRGSPCRAFVKVEASRAYYYPDVVVTCADQDTTKAAPRDYLTAPALIVEVLSETTENIDRREKIRAYALLDSLQEYLLVDSRKAQAELYRKRLGAIDRDAGGDAHADQRRARYGGGRLLRRHRSVTVNPRPIWQPSAASPPICAG